MKRAQIFKQWMMALSMVAVVALSTSCTRSTIFEYEGDCGVYYNIRFKYDYNLKYADAFANEVNSVALYIFDENKTLVETIITTDKEALSNENFEIPLQLAPGHYTLLSWCGLMNEESFDLLAETEIGTTTLHEMKVRMHRTEGVQENDLLPLYHGMIELDVTDIPGTYTETISLMKDTRVIRILLYEMSGHPMDENLFSFEITDNNGLYNYDNNRLDDEVITYKPWHVESIFAESESSSRAAEINTVMAELTLGRMDVNNSPMVSIKNTESGEEIFRFPLAEYMLMVRGSYHKNMDEQEFLDRTDDFSMTIILNEGEWVSTVINIFSWRVVINNHELQ
jgi:hypothetical protein